MLAHCAHRNLVHRVCFACIHTSQPYNICRYHVIVFSILWHTLSLHLSTSSCHQHPSLLTSSLFVPSLLTHPHRTQNTATHVVTTTLRRYWEWDHWCECVWKVVPSAPIWTSQISASPATVGVGRMLDVLVPSPMSTELTVVWSVIVCSLTWKGTRSVNVDILLLLHTSHAQVASCIMYLYIHCT